MSEKSHKKESFNKGVRFPRSITVLISLLLVTSVAFVLFGPTNPPTASEKKASFCNTLPPVMINIGKLHYLQETDAEKHIKLPKLTTDQINTMISYNNAVASSAPNAAVSKSFNEFSSSLKLTNGVPVLVGKSIMSFSKSIPIKFLTQYCTAAYAYIGKVALKEYYKLHPQGGKPFPSAP